MKIYDSYSGKLTDFKPINEGKVGIYVCGPTVYDSAHLGHGRSATVFDVIRKYFIYKYGKENVTYVSNYTDIDDKMIKRAKEAGLSVTELAEKVIPEYEADYKALGISPPDIQPKATEYIDSIVEVIKDLESKGYTYVIEGDGVYYDVTKFKKYGALSKQNLEDLKMGARVDVNDNKRNPYDFALWKFKKEGEPFWPSSWGDGRPGWHVECSAMSWKNLGEKFDIHGGGLDLKFPHHECEIAQSQGSFGDGSFAKYWIHNGFININNEKMSKSLGNFHTLKDVFKKYNPQVVRLMYLRTHYRNPIDFSEDVLNQARATLDNLHNFSGGLRHNYDILEEDGTGEIYGDKFLNEFEKYMDEDFNTSEALGCIFQLKDEINALRNGDNLTKKQVDSAEKCLKKIDEVLGVIYPLVEAKLSDEEKNLIKEREEARKNKNFTRADEIRLEVEQKGIILEDSSNGTVWKKSI